METKISIVRITIFINYLKRNQCGKKWLLYLLLLIGTSVSATELKLKIPSLTVIHQSDPRIYGHFLEHIHHSVNGGLWGEVVWNRSFEQEEPMPRELRGKLTLDEWKQQHPARYWLADGKTEISQIEGDALNGKKCLQIHTQSGLAGNLYQEHLHVQKGDALDGSIWIKGNSTAGLSLELLDQARGNSTLAKVWIRAGDNQIWTEYPIHLEPTDTSAEAELRMTIPPSSDIKLDQLCLMPKSAQITGGYRPDLLEALKELHPALIRWPGGDFVFGFNWKESIGPVSKRGNKSGWGDLDPLGLGLDEYMKLCQLVGAEPLLVVDINVNRPDLVQQAADLVEYCNGSSETLMGKLRAAYGHREPYHVKLWEVGNEMWRIKPEEYAAAFLETSQAMRKIDPTIECIASGSGQLGQFRNTHLLDEKLIKTAAEKIDYLSIHHYEDADKFATGPAEAVAYWNHLRELIQSSTNPHMKLFMSEWNAMSIDWRGGLYAGGLLNEMERSPIMGMASPALLMRHTSAKTWDNAFINFDASRSFESPSYIVMKLWRDNYSPDVLELKGNVEKLNILPVKGLNGNIIKLKIVNPYLDPAGITVTMPQDFKVECSSATWVHSKDLKGTNSFETPQMIRPQSGQVEVEHNTIHFNVPAYAAGIVSAKQSEK